MEFTINLEDYNFGDTKDESNPFKKYKIELFHFPMMATYKVSVKEQWWQFNNPLVDKNGITAPWTEAESYEGTSVKKANEIISAYLEHIRKLDNTLFMGFTVGGDIMEAGTEANRSLIHEFDMTVQETDPEEKHWVFGRILKK